MVCRVGTHELLCGGSGAQGVAEAELQQRLCDDGEGRVSHLVCGELELTLTRLPPLINANAKYKHIHVPQQRDVDRLKGRAFSSTCFKNEANSHVETSSSA